MISNEEQVQAAIAEQAGEWFVKNDEGVLNAPDSAALAAWLKTSPVHVEKFLGVSAIARDLRQLGEDPEFSVDAVVASAGAEHSTPIQPLWPRLTAPVRQISSRRWLTAAMTMTAVAVLSLGLFSLRNARPIAPGSSPGGATALYLQTRHGEQLSRHLADGSVLNLNTDSAVTVRYDKTARLVTLTSGQADFEVAHEAGRDFRVFAGAAEVIAIGTKFDVHLEHGSTVVTVVEGRVAVGPSPRAEHSATGSGRTLPPFVQVAADQQIRVSEGAWPAAPAGVDAQSATAWLRREIVFDHESLAQVTAEFNRYGSRPIEIATPALRTLQISGVFSTSDPDAFIAFLRSLKGVQVEMTATRVRVSQD